MAKSSDNPQSTVDNRVASTSSDTSSDTIAAISSAIGPAQRMIVRTSGTISGELLRHLAPQVTVEARRWTKVTIALPSMPIPAHVLLFKSPNTFTGEDIVEYHLPGNPLIARHVLEALVAAGARLAQPGEFSARAFFNGRVNLSEAEAIAATIAAGNDRQLAAARQLAAGELSRRLLPATDGLADALALLEAGIDFSDQEVSFINENQLRDRLDAVDQVLSRLLEQSDRFDLTSQLPTVVLVGKPNAGKSTLLNALAGHARAVVSSQAGTTRDAISVDVTLRRGIVRIVDIAGLEDVSTDASTLGDIHRAMQSNARRAIESADVVVAVVDVTDDTAELPVERRPDIVAHSKSDIRNIPELSDAISVSAHSGAGLPMLREALDAIVFGRTAEGGTLALAVRHVESINAAREAIARARSQSHELELIAADLRAALDHLGEVNGAITPDDVIGRVFARFCIGK